MLDLVKEESERIDSRFLEPACGSGNFLVRVLQRKLAAVELKFGKSEFEKRQYALLGLMCTYGIELLPDNIVECRANMLIGGNCDGRSVRFDLHLSSGMNELGAIAGHDYLLFQVKAIDLHSHP